MSFDPLLNFHDENGEVADQAGFDAWHQALFDRFAASPQGAATGSVDWLDLVCGFADGWFACTVLQLEPDEFAQIVWEVIPNKLSCDPEEAPAIVEELRAFWEWADQELGLPQAAACRGVLGPGAEDRLQAALGDRSNWGMAKSLFLGGGLSEESGTDTEWAGVRLLGELGEVVRGLEAERVAEKNAAAKVTKRKQQRRSRKTNRRKKKKR